ncbi:MULTISPECIES: hypothetical protein [Aeromicrobium]|uniref:Uncharacterized protein n=1 Tax=Aeromicrobium yanjiei TaxID=2662028 RepID=A0A5Q2MJS0_9ACTN|nr:MULTISPECIES: hypothetical protein [Aeromicrobium]QGG41282.1 hypothetical protein GEV26_07835 [Aeromicrobium yanjiei]
MRSPRTLFIAAGLLLAVGIVLVLTSDSGQVSEYGWFAYAPESDSISMGGSFVVLTTREVLGWSAGWLGTLLAAAAMGYRFAARRRASD